MMSTSSESPNSAASPRTRYEETLNEWTAQWLSKNVAAWEVSAEEIGAIEGTDLRPDVLVRQSGRNAAALEFEFGNPAVGDATRLLGETLVGEQWPFSEVLAVGYSEDARHDDQQRFNRRLDEGELFLTIQIVSDRNGAGDAHKAWPDTPLPASAQELVAYIEYLQVPQLVIEDLSERIAVRIASASKKLHDVILLSKAISDETLASLREITGAEHVPADSVNGNGKTLCPDKCGHDAQAVSTACAIWLGAVDLHYDLARHSGVLKNRGLRSTTIMREDGVLGFIISSEMYAEWRLIAELNYLPVIELGISCLRVCFPFAEVMPTVLTALDILREQVNTVQTKHVYNFAGELWQRLVPDREERAAHYTKPHVAELLATLATERFANLAADSIRKLNILDAACGTGTLIAAGERAIRRKFREAGGSEKFLHRERMENHIFAMDVNGIAGTLTAKRLTDLELEQDYTRSQIAVITHPAGSLMLLDPGTTGVSQVLGYKGVTQTKGPGGDAGVFHIPDGSIDLALMNPPYSRPRKGRRQETTGLVPLRNAAKKRGYTMSHGNAGLATDFGDLSNLRLKPGGVFAHVLPLTAARASSWQKWRAQLESDFTDIVVISATESMSADTNLGEILVIATKQRGAKSKYQGRDDLLCVNLDKEFSTLPEGYSIAKEVARIPADSMGGNLSLGTYTRFKPTKRGNPWSAIGDSDREVNSIVEALVNGEVWDPNTNTRSSSAVPMSTLRQLASSGPTHDLIGHLKDGDGRGAFEWTPLSELSRTPTQQALWSADAKSQTSIRTMPTHGGLIVNEDLANRMIPQRSQWFIKRNMRWTSQATSVAHTAMEVHGGTSWNALLEGDEQSMQAVALFYNSVFGGLLLNAYGSIQQTGRARLQVNAIAGLHCPAFNADTPEAERARTIASEHFDELSQLDLMPFASCINDDIRHKIDSVVADMLGLDSDSSQTQSMLDRYRYVFARQPNVNGGQRRHLDAVKRYEAERG